MSQRQGIPILFRKRIGDHVSAPNSRKRKRLRQTSLPSPSPTPDNDNSQAERSETNELGNKLPANSILEDNRSENSEDDVEFLYYGKPVKSGSIEIMDLEEDGSFLIKKPPLANEWPHPRETCILYPFHAPKKVLILMPRKKQSDNLHYCENCYCYVCEGKASECVEWKIHCHATVSQAEWKGYHDCEYQQLVRKLSYNQRCATRVLIDDIRGLLRSIVDHDEKEEHFDDYDYNSPQLLADELLSKLLEIKETSVKDKSDEENFQAFFANLLFILYILRNYDIDYLGEIILLCCTSSYCSKDLIQLLQNALKRHKNAKNIIQLVFFLVEVMQDPNSNDIDYSQLGSLSLNVSGRLIKVCFHRTTVRTRKRFLKELVSIEQLHHCLFNLLDYASYQTGGLALILQHPAVQVTNCDNYLTPNYVKDVLSHISVSQIFFILAEYLIGGRNIINLTAVSTVILPLFMAILEDKKINDEILGDSIALINELEDIDLTKLHSWYKDKAEARVIEETLVISLLWNYLNLLRSSEDLNVVLDIIQKAEEFYPTDRFTTLVFDCVIKWHGRGFSRGRQMIDLMFYLLSKVVVQEDFILERLVKSHDLPYRYLLAEACELPKLHNDEVIASSPIYKSEYDGELDRISSLLKWITSDRQQKSRCLKCNAEPERLLVCITIFLRQLAYLPTLQDRIDFIVNRGPLFGFYWKSFIIALHINQDFLNNHDFSECVSKWYLDFINGLFAQMTEGTCGAYIMLVSLHIFATIKEQQTLFRRFQVCLELVGAYLNPSVFTSNHCQLHHFFLLDLPNESAFASTSPRLASIQDVYLRPFFGDSYKYQPYDHLLYNLMKDDWYAVELLIQKAKLGTLLRQLAKVGLDVLAELGIDLEKYGAQLATAIEIRLLDQNHFTSATSILVSLEVKIKKTRSKESLLTTLYQRWSYQLITKFASIDLPLMFAQLINQLDHFRSDLMVSHKILRVVHKRIKELPSEFSCGEELSAISYLYAYAGRFDECLEKYTTNLEQWCIDVAGQNIAITVYNMIAFCPVSMLEKQCLLMLPLFQRPTAYGLSLDNDWSSYCSGMSKNIERSLETTLSTGKECHCRCELLFYLQPDLAHLHLYLNHAKVNAESKARLVQWVKFHRLPQQLSQFIPILHVLQDECDFIDYMTELSQQDTVLSSTALVNDFYNSLVNIVGFVKTKTKLLIIFSRYLLNYHELLVDLQLDQMNDSWLDISDSIDTDDEKWAKICLKLLKNPLQSNVLYKALKSYDGPENGLDKIDTLLALPQYYKISIPFYFAGESWSSLFTYLNSFTPFVCYHEWLDVKQEVSLEVLSFFSTVLGGSNDRLILDKLFLKFLYEYIASWTGFFYRSELSLQEKFLDILASIVQGIFDQADSQGSKWIREWMQFALHWPKMNREQWIQFLLEGDSLLKYWNENNIADSGPQTAFLDLLFNPFIIYGNVYARSSIMVNLICIYQIICAAGRVDVECHNFASVRRLLQRFVTFRAYYIRNHKFVCMDDGVFDPAIADYDVMRCLIEVIQVAMSANVAEVFVEPVMAAILGKCSIAENFEAVFTTKEDFFDSFSKFTMVEEVVANKQWRKLFSILARDSSTPYAFISHLAKHNCIGINLVVDLLQCYEKGEHSNQFRPNLRNLLRLVVLRLAGKPHKYPDFIAVCCHLDRMGMRGKEPLFNLDELKVVLNFAQISPLLMNDTTMDIKAELHYELIVQCDFIFCMLTRQIMECLVNDDLLDIEGIIWIWRQMLITDANKVICMFFDLLPCALDLLNDDDNEATIRIWIEFLKSMRTVLLPFKDSHALITEKLNGLNSAFSDKPHITRLMDLLWD